MKLKDIIANLDKSEKNRDRAITWDLEPIISYLQLSCYGVNQDSDNPRLKCYWIAGHCCTDTWVGIRAYFLDDEFVAVSNQPARKSDEVFQWVSLEAAGKVRDYIISLIEYDPIDDYVDFVDMDCEMGDGYFINYTGQSLKNSVIYNNELVTIVENKEFNEDKTYNFHNIVIKHSDGRTETIDIRETLSPWNLKG